MTTECCYYQCAMAVYLCQLSRRALEIAFRRCKFSEKWLGNMSFAYLAQGPSCTPAMSMKMQVIYAHTESAGYNVVTLVADLYFDIL